MLDSVTRLIENIKRYFRPARTRFLYPDVEFGGSAIADNNCEFGKHIKIYEDSIISSSKIDSYTYVGGRTFIKNSEIGKFCSISEDVRIGLGIHPVDCISTYPGFYSNKASGAVKLYHDKNIKEYQQVIIGNDVWIGSRVMIVDGVTIQDGAIIAAGSVVTRDVGPYCIVGGTPAKLIRKRFDEEKIRLLLEFKWWEKDLKYLRANAKLFLKPKRFFQFIGENE